MVFSLKEGVWRAALRFPPRPHLTASRGQMSLRAHPLERRSGNRLRRLPRRFNGSLRGAPRDTVHDSS